jgi:hypothetical protein
MGRRHVGSVELPRRGILAGGAPADFWAGNCPFKGLAHHRPGAVAPDALVPDIFDDDVSVAGVCSEPMAPVAGDPNALPIEAGWASAPDDVWFVGDRAYHYDGQRWSCPPLGSTVRLHGVWGTSRSDVWAVGDGGALLHFGGDRWTSVPSPTTETLNAVWASGPCDVWAVGDAVYHAVSTD